MHDTHLQIPGAELAPGFSPEEIVRVVLKEIPTFFVVVLAFRVFFFWGGPSQSGLRHSIKLWASWMVVD